MPPVERLTTKSPYQEGNTDIGFRINQKIVAFVFDILSRNPSEYYDQRNELQDIFKPLESSSPVTIKMVRFGETRQLQGHYIRGLEINTDDAGRMTSSGYYHRFAVELQCNEPFWINSAINSEIISLQANTELFFPIIFNDTLPDRLGIVFGSSTIDESFNITYPGQWKTYPKLILLGPLSDFILENETTDELLGLNYDISDGETVTIDLAPNVKTVRNGAGDNLNGTLSTNSDLNKFHIEADPEAPGGVNTFNVQGTNTSSSTRITIEYYTRYLDLNL